MNINIKASGMDLTPAIKESIEEKVGQIDKYVADTPDAMAQVEVGKVTHHNKGEDVFRAEIHLTGGGLDVYAVSKQADLYIAINDVKEQAIKEIRRSKGKAAVLYRKGGKMIKDMMRGMGEFGNRFRPKR